ncbi:alpha,alpha-trehalase [Necator americanus]|uniref:Trehalase n=1 Tax=Necator americanus TaxID=51031 RepID=W2SHS8_NECAM|nr:alpha,alpha-trehalase [Necator americanus]ETN68426.1 alpha,alpha-trehalase [Necator americanus]
MKKKIFCEGSLLDAVQRANLFADCKHFVDMPLKQDAETTLVRWEALRATGPVSVERLRQFVDEFFDQPEEELVECEPADWEPTDDAFHSIKDSKYRDFAIALHKKWPTLYRKISDSVRIRPERYSIIPVPNPFVVPGGRFREIYYWDSFFIIKGLLASRMYATVRGMIENMQYLIEEYVSIPFFLHCSVQSWLSAMRELVPNCSDSDQNTALRFGFVPNGNRIYYLNRSQPPVLTWCVHAYYMATNDLDFVEKLLPTLRKEMAFFQTNRSIIMEGWPGPLYRYRVVVNSPRPESYREDIKSAEHLHEEIDKQKLWGDIAAAAESGRDFSSRWFSHSGPMAGKLEGTRTSEIVPVDLNAIICGNLQLMGDLYDAIGDIEGSKWCAQSADLMKQTIYQVLWNETAGCWFDYDIPNDKHLRMFSDTNFFPMFTRATHSGFKAERVVNYLRITGVLDFPGGVPSSLVASGQQWDFPNAWAPTMWILIEGLRRNDQHEVALQITEKWVRKNFNMWRASGGKMYEKYNVVSACYKIIGGGGEYDLQEGFGWTNGVLLDLLVTYGNELTWSADEECRCCVLDCICLV